MPPRIFISYSSKDSETAKFIHAELEKCGIDVFIDYRGLDEGDDFHERLAGEIKSRDSVLFLLSQHSIVSDWVRIELKFAFKHHKQIVPLALDDSKIPDALFFVDLVHRRAFTRSNEDIARLCKVLGLSEEKAPSSPDPLSYANTERRNSVPNPVQKQVSASIFQRKTSLEILPAPFAWIDIPGKVGKTWKGEPYQIAKYPVTNAQYKVFVMVGGYEQKKWWTEEGWRHRQQRNWIEPRYWNDSTWNGGEYPVIGVSWFEAVAFCLWLSDMTGEKIMLPTEEQWQYAAQGDDGRKYPWGTEWEDGRCNSNVNKKGVGKTSPVQQYEGKGDSPFGAVDMAGNVWEWCSITVKNKLINAFTSSVYHGMRGGSWYLGDPSRFRNDRRGAGYPYLRDYDWGFRLSNYT